MLNSVPRRDFLKLSAITSLALLSEPLFSLNSALADTQDGKTEENETYHVYIPYQLARYGGKKTITLRSGDSATFDIRAQLKDNNSIILSGQGINNQDIEIFCHTLYDFSSPISKNIYDEIDKCNLRFNYSTKSKCKSAYTKLKHAKELDNEDLSLLDYIISTSHLDQDTIDRYNIASQNYRIELIENKINLAIQKQDLPSEDKKLLLGTLQYVKALEPISSFNLLDVLDIIVAEIPDLSLAFKSLYSQASSISRAYTADYIIVSYITSKFTYPEFYLTVYDKIRDGSKLSKKNGEIRALNSLTKYIYNSNIESNVKAIYLVTVKEMLSEDDSYLGGDEDEISRQEILDLYDRYLNTKDDLKDAWEYGSKVTPLVNRTLASIGVKAGTGTALSSLSGAAATNATLAWLGGGSVATGGLGMLGGIAVVSGGAAFIGAAGILSMMLFADLDGEDLSNLGISTLMGVIAGTGSVGLVWVTATSMGIAGTATGAAAISATMAALGGLSVMTGGASLVAFAVGSVVWSFLDSNKKRNNEFLHYLESASYALQGFTDNPIAQYIEDHPVEGDEKRFFVAPQMSLELLNNALGSFANQIMFESDEKIVALFDTSFWNDAKEGIILTDREVIYKKSGNETKRQNYISLSPFDIYNVSLLLSEENRISFQKLLTNIKDQKLALI